MRASITLLIALAAIALAGPGAAQSTASGSGAPGWMAGCWSQDKAPKWTEECWMGPRGGVMLGAGRAGAGDKLNEWEAMQIILGADGKLDLRGALQDSPELAAAVAAELEKATWRKSGRTKKAVPVEKPGELDSGPAKEF